GSGKQRAAILMLEEFLDVADSGLCAVGLIDRKGESFAQVYTKCTQSNSWRRPLRTLDLSNRALVAYDILLPQNGESSAELISRRMETFGDLLGDTDLSRRMQRMLRFLLTLLVECRLSFAVLDHIVECPEIAVQLAAKCSNDRLQRYFRGDFLKEQGVTLSALRYRLDPLLTPESVRLSLSAGEPFDFTAALD